MTREEALVKIELALAAVHQVKAEYEDIVRDHIGEDYAIPTPVEFTLGNAETILGRLHRFLKAKNHKEYLLCAMQEVAESLLTEDND